MILVDTGPLVAVYDPRDPEHGRCVSTLQGINDRLITTTPVLTEAFHMLGAASRGSVALRELIAKRGMDVWRFDEPALLRAFELMEIYADHPMDLADASLVAAAESLGIDVVFTLDRRDFASYRVRHGHRYHPFEILPRGRR